MRKKSLLFVDVNQSDSGEAEAYFLENGYHVVVHGDYMKTREMLSRGMHGPDLAVFWLSESDQEGYELLARITETGDTAVIVLSDDSRLESQLYAYSKGIDELLIRPVPPVLLDAHIEAVLRRTTERKEPAREAGALSVDYEGRIVYLEGKPLPVTAKEFELLLYFMRHRGMTLSRDRILDAVWGFDYFGSYRNVDTLVKKLRAKLSEKYPYIRTVYGIGYCFDVQGEEKK